VELWFEANAMRGQFEHYTEHIMLRPFGGDPSIPFKWNIAAHLTRMAERFSKPIVILYFGDLDPKGMIIPESAVRDIREWCTDDFEFIRCGLNPGHETEFSLIENPERPGTYQWEALDDGSAHELIERSCAPFVSPGGYSEIGDREAAITGRFRAEMGFYMDELLDSIKEAR